MKIGHHEYFLRSSETFYEVLEIARVNSYVQKEVMVKYEYAKIQAKCSTVCWGRFKQKVLLKPKDHHSMEGHPI